MSTALAPTGIDRVDLATRTWQASSLLPAHFRNTDGSVKVADLQIASLTLNALDIDPVRNLPDVYVVNGRCGLMAEVQRAIAARDGWELELVEATPMSATWRIRRPGGQWKLATVTMAQAVKAGWTRNKCYETMPERMLSARACTLAVSLNAPGILRGMADAVTELDMAIPAEGDGKPTTDERAFLRACIDRFGDGARAWLFGVAKSDELPNIDGPRFTLADRDRLAWHLLNAQQITEPGAAPAAPDEGDAAEPVPADVHDDTEPA
jgi:hypothetical protein